MSPECDAAPRFTVVITTRNRPTLFANALASVMAQTSTDFEIVVVDDGSAEEHAPSYAQVLAQARASWAGRVELHGLARRARGHGSGYSMNRGIERARGEYIAFLDDDDLWIDEGHLERADAIIQAHGSPDQPVDLYLSNQEAVAEGELLPHTVWIESMEGHLRRRGRVSDGVGAYRVSVKELLMAEGFCHMNCLIARRDLLLRLGGRDESIGWEGDRELYLRLLDNAGTVLHHPGVVARHHVPDPRAGLSITTALQKFERQLWQLRLLDKSALMLRSALLRAYAIRHKGYTLKRITEQFAARGDWSRASRFAVEALAVLPTFKWALFAMHTRLRNMTARPQAGGAVQRDAGLDLGSCSSLEVGAEAGAAATPRFSIVLPTRDRPTLFQAALASVMDQEGTDTEIIVVDDGSTEAHRQAYGEILARARERVGERLRCFQLPRLDRGHGSSYAMNHGANNARGEYLCFLDDDDVWTDREHLRRADSVIRQRSDLGPVDAYMANQEAVRGGELLTNSIWLEALQAQLRARGRKPDALGAFEVSTDELLLAGGFCHFNCLVVRRRFFEAIKGIDESIRWENDREFFLRILDGPSRMVHHPAVIARHHVPEPAASASITTQLKDIERRLWQLRVMDKCTVMLRTPALRDYARLHRGYTLKRLSELMTEQGDWRVAAVYAREGLAVLPTLKWAAYTLVCHLRGLRGRPLQPAEEAGGALHSRRS